MSELITLLAISIPLAFFMGFAIGRGDICAVAAVSFWVNSKRAAYLRAFIIAIASAGLALLPCTWLFPDIIKLSKAYQISEITLMAGALFGLGAFLNGACVFGTLAHISKGEINYVGTIVGMFIGALATPLLKPQIESNYFLDLSHPTPLAILTWLAFILITANELRLRRQLIKFNYFAIRSKHVWDPILSMAIIGINGGLLYATIGNWGYLTVLSHDAAKLLNPSIPDVTIQVFSATGALILGAIVAAWKTHKLKIRKPGAAMFVRKMLGGSLMSFSALIIPGGNDTLLLYGIPSLAPHAFVAYLIMLTTLFALFWIRKILPA